mgnify:CR=1 FL=1
MFTTIINVLFSASLFITGGHVLSSNLKLHHYTDKDYEEIWHLKNKTSISKNCTKHSELESIKKTRRSQPDNGGSRTDYKVTKVEILEKVEKNSE